MSNKQIFIFIILILILGTLVTVVTREADRASSGKYDDFAKCLASKNLTMYGAVWCSHCKAEKARFEGSFKYVPYVECTENPDLCAEKEIKGYPTWIDANGIQYQGEQGLEKLSEISGCALPAN